MLGARCYRLALLVRVTSGCGRACTCWRPLTSRQPPYGSGGASEDIRRPVHQDFLARRCDPSHAGADGGAAPAAGRAGLLGGGGGGLRSSRGSPAAARTATPEAARGPLPTCPAGEGSFA